MSVVACRINEDHIEVSADSICVQGWTQEKTSGKFAKLFEVGDMVIGGVGLASENVLMQVFALTHKPASPTEADMVVFLSEFSAWKKARTDKFDMENDFIFAFEGKAFATNGFCIKEISRYEAIGAGRDFALAALYLGQGTVKAVETACELSVYCERPVITKEVRR